MHDYGPWITHDGAGIEVPDGTHLQVSLLRDGIGLTSDTCDFATVPNAFWRWRRVRTGFFRSELRRVCDNPAFAPIIAYRIRKPRALMWLKTIAENPSAPIPERRPDRVLP